MGNICLCDGCKALEGPHLPPLLHNSPQFPYYYLFLALFFWIPLSFSAFYSPLWNKHEKLWKVSKYELLQWSHTRKRVNEVPKRISGTVFWGGGIRREARYCQRNNHWANLGVAESEIRLVQLVFYIFRGNPFLPSAAWESKFISQVMPILCIKPKTWAPTCGSPDSVGPQCCGSPDSVGFFQTLCVVPLCLCSITPSSGLGCKVRTWSP